MARIKVVVTSKDKPDATLGIFEADDELSLMKENVIVNRLVTSGNTGDGIRFYRVDDNGNSLNT